MQWTLRRRFILMITFLMFLASAGIGSFFIPLYRQDKTKTILEAELRNTQFAAQHLEDLLQLVDVIAPQAVLHSKEIIFLLEDPCSEQSKTKSMISLLYEKQFKYLELNPKEWTESLALFQACGEFAHPISNQSDGPHVQIVHFDLQLMTPYIAILSKGPQNLRFALVSMDGFTTSALNTLFLADSAGKVLWSADGEKYLNTAFEDTQISLDDLGKIAQANNRADDPTEKSTILPMSEDGLLSFAPITEDWKMYSLTYKPTVMFAVDFAVRQLGYFALGFLFFCLWIANRATSRITRPLQILKESAQKVADGHFDLVIDVQGTDEISALQQSFNKMTEKISLLMWETTVKAQLESEMEVAKKTQQMFLPPDRLEVLGHQFHAFAQSADQCGGDWWGLTQIAVENGAPKLLLLIGDVTGHGTASALITASIRGSLSAITQFNSADPSLMQEPTAVLNILNRAVYDAAKGSLWMTLFAGIIDLDKETIHCANAGHLSPYLFTRSPQGDSFQTQRPCKLGAPLGQQPDAVYETFESHPWKMGSKLLLFSDGLIDCPTVDGNTFDRRSLQKMIKSVSNLSAQQILTEILKKRSAFMKGQSEIDDVTAVACEWQGGNT